MPIVIDFASRDWHSVPPDDQRRASDYMVLIIVGYRATHYEHRYGWLWGTSGVVCTWCHVPFLKDELGVTRVEGADFGTEPVPGTAVCLECAEAEYLGSQGRAGGAGSVLDRFRVPAGAEEMF